MSRTATTEACPANWRQPYWLETDDGQCVPLTISDPRAESSSAVVFKLDSRLKAKGHALRIELKMPIPPAFSTRRSISTEHSARPYPPQEILAPAYMAPVHDHTASGLPRREAFGLDVATIMRNSFPEHPSTFPGSPTDADRKEYCTYWIRHGECDYMQQGCRYKHEMPDLMVLRSIGFRNVPEWHKEKMRMRNMQRPVRSHADVLQSILNRAGEDSASESGSDDSDATLAEATRRPPVSSPAAHVVVQKAPPSPAPSTIDLLSFDDDNEDSSPGQTFEVPANTPRTSSHTVPSPPTPNRKGRFVPAGESLPRILTPPLQPTPPSPTFYKKEEPNFVVEKTVYTAPPRPAPIFKQYCKEIKAAKSQEALALQEQKEEVKEKGNNSKAPTTLVTQIAELQAKLAILAAETTKAASNSKCPVASPSGRVKTLPAPVSRNAASPGNTPRAVTNAAQAVVNGGGNMASKHADRQFRIHPQGQTQGQMQGKVSRRGRSRARGEGQESSEFGSSGEKKGRRVPAARARKVVAPKVVGGGKGRKEVVVVGRQ